MNKTSRKIFPSLIGNEKLKSILSSDIEAGKAAHAYILEGAHGSGKFTAAMNICTALMCENRTEKQLPLPCGKCASCKKFLSGKHADVLVIQKEDGKASIGVDSIRLIKQTLYIAPNDGERKFYIIKNAELMTAQAQNALLLSLEEPPEFVMFFLLCEDSSYMLETIKSRAPVIKTEKFSASFVEKILSEKYSSVNPENITRAAHLSSGSIGRAVELYENGENELSLYKKAEKLASHLTKGKKSELISFVRSSLPKDRADTCTVLSLTRQALRDLIAAKKGAETLFYSESRMPAFARKISSRRTLEIIEKLEAAEEDISRNISQITVMTHLVMSL